MRAGLRPMLISISQASVPRDVLPPTPPGPEGSNGNGLLRVQWVTGAWLIVSLAQVLFGSVLIPLIRIPSQPLRIAWCQHIGCTEG